MDLDIDGAGQPQLKLPDAGYRPPRRPQAPVMQDLAEARANLRKYGKGILRVPPPYRQPGPKSLITADPPRLPPKELANRLLGQYYACIHSVLPVIHWPTFVAQFEEVYQAGTLLGVPREWAAVLFGVFACGRLHTLEPNREQEGKEFVTVSCGVIDVWQDNFTLDQARAALLVSIFLYEVNSQSASWVWIGSAIRVAQEIGLHLESGPWPPLEGEMRKRLWWGMYTWDRYELPAMVHSFDIRLTVIAGYSLWRWENQFSSTIKTATWASRVPSTSNIFQTAAWCRKAPKRPHYWPPFMWFDRSASCPER